MNPEIDLNQLVDEFLRFEKYVEESKQYQRVVAAPSLSDDQLFLEQDWQRFVAYRSNQAGVPRWYPRRDTQRLRFAAREAHRVGPAGRFGAQRARQRVATRAKVGASRLAARVMSPFSRAKAS